jgi:hypothetical protein
MFGFPGRWLARNENSSAVKYVVALIATLVVALIAIAPFVVPIAYGGRSAIRMQAARESSASLRFPESQ